MNTGCFNYYEPSSVFHGSLMNVMGTRFDMVMVEKSKSESEKIWLRIISGLHRLNNMLNRFDDASEISRINRQAFAQPVNASNEMWTILQSCKQYHQQTAGLFDITLKDFSTVVFHEDHHLVSFSLPDTSLDLGGYAKGYAMRKIREMLLDAGVQHCFVDFGNSSVLGMGHHPYGDSWKVSIENPFLKGQILDEITLRDDALSVSGNMPEYTGHIIRPISGEYNRQRKLVCIIARNPLDAEVLTTACMIATPGEKQQLLNGFNIKKILEYNLPDKENVEE